LWRSNHRFINVTIKHAIRNKNVTNKYLSNFLNGTIFPLWINPKKCRKLTN
jgi:hypothetical protein